MSNLLQLAFIYLMDIRNRSADVVQTLDMCDALQELVQVRLYHPAITSRRLAQEIAYWDADAKWQLRRLVSPGPHPSRWFDYPGRLAFLMQVLLDLRRNRVDAIFTRDPSLLYLLFGLRGALRPEAPIIYEAHKLYHKVSSRVSSGAHEAQVMARADFVVAISPAVRDGFIELGFDSERIEAIPLGVRVDRFQVTERKAAAKKRVGLDPARAVIVYAGSWDEGKGPELLVEAFGRFAGIDGGPILVILGIPSVKIVQLRKRLWDLGIANDQLALFEYLPRRRVVEWLSASDIGVAPNENTLLSGRYTSPLKVFEYLAAGLAVVASDVPALRAVLTERETVFTRVADAEHMASQLQRLVRCSVELAARQQAARDRAASFDYKLRARRLVSICRRFA